MDTTKIIKLLVILQILLVVTGSFISLPVHSPLPPWLQEYLSYEREAEMDIVELLAFSILIIYMISVAGLLSTKMWARNLYAFSILLNYASISLMGPTVEHALVTTQGFRNRWLDVLMGPTVEHAFFTTLAHLDSLTSGAILVLLYFTSSAFNKTHQ